MYVPEHFNEKNPEVIREIVENFPLATLFVTTHEKMSANHIPFLLDTEEDGSYTLLAHIANNNELFKDFESGANAMVVYRAEDSYISPNWYPTKQSHHQHVPTWNYQAVHFYGKIQFIDDKKFILNVIGRLTKLHEKRIGEERPWRMSDAPADYLEQMVSAVTGIRLRARNVIAKSKLSQNREGQDFDNIVEKTKELGKMFLHRQMSKIQKQQKNKHLSK